MFDIDQKDVDIVDILVEMYVNTLPLCAEDKEALSEGDSGASSEEHQRKRRRCLLPPVRLRGIHLRH